ncbi:MAG: glycosyltransferase family 4 protein [Planctomycetota bacterium]|jgi:glycosyltransferase involved in cell wall biosynthesis
MRIAFNGLGLTPRMTGIRRASLHTLRALQAQNPDAEMIVFLPQDAPAEFDGANTIRTALTLDRPMAPLLGEEFILRGAKFDVCYSPSYLLPTIPGARADVVCVHDLSPRFRQHLERRLPRATRVVCPSRSTADALADEFNLEPSVVPHGVDTQRFHPGADRREDPFVAVVSNSGLPDEVDTVLEAFPSFRARLRPCRLVVVGEAGQAPSAPVDFVDCLDDDALAELYRRALMVVQPSHYEGFDLPLLEAMACGTPVACADTPFFREITGGHARFFNPRDARSIADTMAELASDGDGRAELARQGVVRAREWGWDRSARKLWDVLEEAAS